MNSVYLETNKLFLSEIYALYIGENSENIPQFFISKKKKPIHEEKPLQQVCA